VSTAAAPRADRGFVFITRNAGGVSTVEICGGVDERNRAAVDVFASYERCSRLEVDRVELTSAGRHAWSRRMVEVYPDLTTETVVVRPLTT
jgi:hypothetical protein